MVAALRVHFRGQECFTDATPAFCKASPWAEVADVLQQPAVTSSAPLASLSPPATSPETRRGREVCSLGGSPSPVLVQHVKQQQPRPPQQSLLSATGRDAVRKARSAGVREAAQVPLPTLLPWLSAGREADSELEHRCPNLEKKKKKYMERAKIECDTQGWKHLTLMA